MEKNMKEYIQTTVKRELMNINVDGRNIGEEVADAICQTFINKPQRRQDIIEEYNLQSIRVCQHCGKAMREGYVVDDYDTYCCEQCVKQDRNMTDEEFEETILHAEETDAPIYYTAWEG